jgi:DHA3 family macrolide efflux protein-like MFS transporter
MNSAREIDIIEEEPRERRKWAVPFFTVWTGQAFSLIGSQIVSFSLIWYLTQTTGSARVLALASLAGLVPMVLIGPFSGVLVDRWNRRWIMIVADGIVTLTTIALVILFALKLIQPWMIYCLLLVRATAGGIQNPAMLSSTSLMVPKKHLTRVQGLNQILQGGLNIISAPLGALLLGILPMAGVLSIDIITACMAIITLLLVRIPQPKRVNNLAGGAQGVGTILSELKDGFRYVFSWPGLRFILLIGMLINLFIQPALVLAPLLVKNHFNGGAIQLGLLESMWGIGFVVGGVILSLWGGFKKRIFTSLLGIFLLGVGLVLFGLIPSSGYNLALGMTFLMAAAFPITTGPFLAIIQAIVDTDMQGRVLTILMSMAAAAVPIGLLCAGPIADALGVQSWYLLAGAACLFMGVVSMFLPSVMHLEEGRGWKSKSKEAYSPTSQPE